MTRFQLRIAGTTFHVTLAPFLVTCALACAVLIMISFVSTLRVSMQRGESLREAQRAGPVATAGFVRARASNGGPLQAAETSRP